MPVIHVAVLLTTLSMLNRFSATTLAQRQAGPIVGHNETTPERLTSTLSPTQSAENPCPEGEFMDLSGSQCRPLVKSFGFNAAVFRTSFSDAEYTLQNCTEESLRDLLLAANSGGGTIILPSCTISLASSLTIPSNVIFQGAGINQTRFVATPGFSGNMLRSKYQSDIIIRDLTVDGASTDSTGILAWYADNVLIERVRVHHNGRSGITFRYAQRITVRYSESHDHIEFHGIGSKDCFPSEDDVPDAEECREDAGDTAPGTLWSRNYALYSNRLYNNGDYGLNAHGSLGEVAGNILDNNLYGSKFPDGSYLWIHHNQMSKNRLWGTRFYNTLELSARVTGHIALFENHFVDNGNYPVRVREPAHNVFIISNQYTDNENNRLRIEDASVTICAGTTEETIAIDGDAAEVGTTEQCNLANVADLFSLSFVYLPVAIY